MASLTSWKPKIAELTPASGPASFGSGSNTLVTGQEQTFASPNYALKFDVVIPVAQSERSRKEHAWMTRLHGGANATRYEYCDGQQKKPVDVGEPATVTFTGGAFTGGAFVSGHGTVPVALDAVKGATIITLGNYKWGWSLEEGDVLGFSPSVYCFHEITEVFENGTYRVEPPLRRDIAASTHRATFKPRLALKFVPGTINYGSFKPRYSSDRSAQFVEVFDEYVETYFGD